MSGCKHYFYYDKQLRCWGLLNVRGDTMSADSYRELAKRGPHDLVQRDPMTLRGKRPGQVTAILAAPGAVPRLNEIYTPKPYTYRGTGEDTLTAWMDDEPAPLPAPERRPRVLLAMCEPCWEELCCACMGDPCCCACQDERGQW